jgi:hypothetical protein
MSRPSWKSRASILMLLCLIAAPPSRRAEAAEGDCDDGRWDSPAMGAILCNGGFAHAERWLPKVRQRLGVSKETALALSRTLARCHDDDREDTLSEPDARQIEAELVGLLRQDPSNLGLAEEIAWMYLDCGGRIPLPSDALLDLVRQAPDPAALALRFDMAGRERQLAIVEAALAARPQDAHLWQTAGDLSASPSWKPAFYEEAWNILSASGTPEEAVGSARAWLVTLIDQGLAEHALAAFQGMPEAVRAQLLGPPPPEPAPKENVRPDKAAQIRDLRMPLALAWLLTGDPDRAAAIAGGVPAAKVAADDKAYEPGLREDQRRLADRWLHPGADDPFDLFVDLLDSNYQQPVFFLALGRLAEREGYPAFAAYHLDRFGYAMRASDETPFEPAPTLPDRLQRAAQGYAAEVEALLHKTDDEKETVRAEGRTAGGPDPAAATIARLLKEPASPPFAEHPLPAGFHPVEKPADLSKERRAAIPARPKLPEGFAAVRIERDPGDGKRVAAIGLSQAYDPVGEVSAGGYWIILSGDGGKTWGRRLYTGLRMNLPYVVRQLSALPLWDGDRLQVEVEVRELDTETISFPPIGLTPKRVESGLYLEIPLADLQRDTDRDGLTDLAEQRLLTDANDPDTDRDGLRDGADPVPSVALARDASPPARALAAFLKQILGVGSGALIEGVEGSYEAGDEDTPSLQGSLWGASEETSFFVADRGTFAAVSPSHRVIVLTSEERDQARKRFGPFYPMEIQIFVLDHAGHRGLLQWSAGWQGGTVGLEEKNGVWTAKEIGGWIT